MMLTELIRIDYIEHTFIRIDRKKYRNKPRTISGLADDTALT
jgi:hypothetical protein